MTDDWDAYHEEPRTIENCKQCHLPVRKGYRTDHKMSCSEPYREEVKGNG